MKKKGLYANMNARKAAGTSRSKAKSTVSANELLALWTRFNLGR